MPVMEQQSKEKLKMDVVGIGIAAVDYIVELTSLPGHDEKVIGQSFTKASGGVLANFSCAASYLGLDVGFISKVGDDSDGQLIIDSLQKYSINTSHIKMDPNANTFITFITVDLSGEKAMVIPPIKTMPSFEDIDEAYIAQSRLVHAHLFDPHVLLKVAKIAKRNNCFLSLDLEPQRLRRCPPEILDELLKLADIIFCNRGALDLLGGINNPTNAISKVKKRIQGILVATLGSSGCLVMNEKSKIFHISAYEITPVDTTGAGDCFAAAFVYGFLQGWDIGKCGSFANAAGAIATTKLGPRGALPNIQEINIFMKHTPIRKAIL